MISTVLGALLPIVVTILLGFVAAWHHDFNAKEAAAAGTGNDMRGGSAEVQRERVLERAG